ncbi:unnamed protein product [Amoebophrya sp. A120]|nr:unnamed protein product [Amoebophrya sp. A120]|eukprot:GSA120T00017019001.1
MEAQRAEQIRLHGEALSDCFTRVHRFVRDVKKIDPEKQSFKRRIAENSLLDGVGQLVRQLELAVQGLKQEQLHQCFAIETTETSSASTSSSSAVSTTTPPTRTPPTLLSHLVNLNTELQSCKTEENRQDARWTKLEKIFGACHHVVSTFDPERRAGNKTPRWMAAAREKAAGGFITSGGLEGSPGTMGAGALGGRNKRLWGAGWQGGQKSPRGNNTSAASGSSSGAAYHQNHKTFKYRRRHTGADRILRDNHSAPTAFGTTSWQARSGGVVFGRGGGGAASNGIITGRGEHQTTSRSDLPIEVRNYQLAAAKRAFATSQRRWIDAWLKPFGQNRPVSQHVQVLLFPVLPTSSGCSLLFFLHKIALDEKFDAVVQHQSAGGTTTSSSTTTAKTKTTNAEKLEYLANINFLSRSLGEASLTTIADRQVAADKAANGRGCDVIESAMRLLKKQKKQILELELRSTGCGGGSSTQASSSSASPSISGKNYKFEDDFEQDHDLDDTTSNIITDRKISDRVVALQEEIHYYNLFVLNFVREHVRELEAAVAEALATEVTKIAVREQDNAAMQEITDLREQYEQVLKEAATSTGVLENTAEKRADVIAHLYEFALEEGVSCCAEQAEEIEVVAVGGAEDETSEQAASVPVVTGNREPDSEQTTAATTKSLCSVLESWLSSTTTANSTAESVRLRRELQFFADNNNNDKTATASKITTPALLFFIYDITREGPAEADVGSVLAELFEECLQLRDKVSKCNDAGEWLQNSEKSFLQCVEKDILGGRRENWAQCKTSLFPHNVETSKAQAAAETTATKGCTSGMNSARKVWLSRDARAFLSSLSHAEKSSLFDRVCEFNEGMARTIQRKEVEHYQQRELRTNVKALIAENEKLRGKLRTELVAAGQKIVGKINESGSASLATSSSKVKDNNAGATGGAAGSFSAPTDQIKPQQMKVLTDLSEGDAIIPPAPPIDLAALEAEEAGSEKIASFLSKLDNSEARLLDLISESKELESLDHSGCTSTETLEVLAQKADDKVFNLELFGLLLDSNEGLERRIRTLNREMAAQVLVQESASSSNTSKTTSNRGVPQHITNDAKDRKQRLGTLLKSVERGVPSATWARRKTADNNSSKTPTSSCASTSSAAVSATTTFEMKKSRSRKGSTSELQDDHDGVTRGSACNSTISTTASSSSSLRYSNSSSTASNSVVNANKLFSPPSRSTRTGGRDTTVNNTANKEDEWKAQLQNDYNVPCESVSTLGEAIVKVLDLTHSELFLLPQHGFEEFANGGMMLRKNAAGAATQTPDSTDVGGRYQRCMDARVLKKVSESILVENEDDLLRVSSRTSSSSSSGSSSSSSSSSMIFPDEVEDQEPLIARAGARIEKKCLCLFSRSSLSTFSGGEDRDDEREQIEDHALVNKTPTALALIEYGGDGLPSSAASTYSWVVMTLTNLLNDENSTCSRSSSSHHDQDVHHVLGDEKNTTPACYTVLMKYPVTCLPDGLFELPSKFDPEQAGVEVVPDNGGERPRGPDGHVTAVSLPVVSCSRQRFDIVQVENFNTKSPFTDIDIFTDAATYSQAREQQEHFLRVDAQVSKVFVWVSSYSNDLSRRYSGVYAKNNHPAFPYFLTLEESADSLKAKNWSTDDAKHRAVGLVPHFISSGFGTASGTGATPLSTPSKTPTSSSSSSTSASTSTSKRTVNCDLRWYLAEIDPLQGYQPNLNKQPQIQGLLETPVSANNSDILWLQIDPEHMFKQDDLRLSFEGDQRWTLLQQYYGPNGIFPRYNKTNSTDQVEQLQSQTPGQTPTAAGGRGGGAASGRSSSSSGNSSACASSTSSSSTSSSSSSSSSSNRSSSKKKNGLPQYTPFCEYDEREFFDLYSVTVGVFQDEAAWLTFMQGFESSGAKCTAKTVQKRLPPPSKKRNYYGNLGGGGRGGDLLQGSRGGASSRARNHNNAADDRGRGNRGPRGGGDPSEDDDSFVNGTRVIVPEQDRKCCAGLLGNINSKRGPRGAASRGQQQHQESGDFLSASPPTHRSRLSPLLGGIFGGCAISTPSRERTSEEVGEFELREHPQSAKNTPSPGAADGGRAGKSKSKRGAAEEVDLRNNGTRTLQKSHSAEQSTSQEPRKDRRAAQDANIKHQKEKSRTTRTKRNPADGGGTTRVQATGDAHRDTTTSKPQKYPNSASKRSGALASSPAIACSPSSPSHPGVLSTVEVAIASKTEEDCTMNYLGWKAKELFPPIDDTERVQIRVGVRRRALTRYNGIYRKIVVSTTQDDSSILGETTSRQLPIFVQELHEAVLPDGSSSPKLQVLRPGHGASTWTTSSPAHAMPAAALFPFYGSDRNDKIGWYLTHVRYDKELKQFSCYNPNSKKQPALANLRGTMCHEDSQYIFLLENVDFSGTQDWYCIQQHWDSSGNPLDDGKKPPKRGQYFGSEHGKKTATLRDLMGFVTAGWVRVDVEPMRSRAPASGLNNNTTNRSPFSSPVATAGGGGLSAKKKTSSPSAVLQSPK